MNNLLTTKIGRLRILAFLEGLSLIILVGIAVPLKYAYGHPELSYVLGRAHGALFLLFVYSTISVAIEYSWQFKTTTWKVLVASFIPFGTFYIDHAILSKVVPVTNK